MDASARTTPFVPSSLLDLLNHHLPHSLPLLRRLQVAKFRDEITEHSRIIVVSRWNHDGEVADSDNFIAAYADFSGGPETQMWLFGTIETKNKVSDADKVECKQLLRCLVDEMIKIGRQYGKETTYPGTLLLGTVHTRLRRILEELNRITPRATGFYDKWLFKAEDLPDKEAQLPEGMSWDTAGPGDCEIVVSRTDIPRTAEMLVKMPNLVIRLADKTPISWAFLGPDGSLISLHCEELYRRRGLAKTLAAKLMRQGPGDFADDGWCTADVAEDNMGSRGMCKSLNGKPHWEVSWVLFDITDESISDASV